MRGGWNSDLDGIVLLSVLESQCLNPSLTSSVLPQAGPLSTECGKAGHIVCHRGKIEGEQGACLLLFPLCLACIIDALGFQVNDVMSK